MVMNALICRVCRVWWRSVACRAHFACVVRVSAMAALLLCGTVQAELYRCPGNLFTNDLDPQQARAMRCQKVVPAGWSQVQPLPGLESLAEEPPAAAPALPVLPAGPAGPASQDAVPGPVTRPQPAAVVPTRLPSSGASQRERDAHARQILQQELQRTQARIESLQARSEHAPGADDAAVLQRLRADEAALRRELQRAPV